MTRVRYDVGMPDVRIEKSWKERLATEFAEPYFQELTAFVRDEYKTKSVFPPPKSIFRAFDECSFEQVRVVILGQDPYHGKNQANGLCFAVSSGIQAPPSLQNIFKELEADLGRPVVRDPDLGRWAKQGVLLLNATLTVRSGQAGSHQGKGWEQFTDAAVAALEREREHLVFILWGNYARAKGARINRARHCVIESPHPSPFSAHSGFFGSRPFSRANTYLEQHGIRPIEW